MKIELRERTAETVITYFNRTQDAEIRRFFPQKATTVEEALRDFQKTQRQEATSYGRTIYVDDKYIGDIWCYCMQEDEPNAMVSYCIFDKGYWGKGVAAESLKLFLAEIRPRYHLKSIGAFTFSANRASIKVLERNGFEMVEAFMEDGIASEYYQTKGNFMAITDEKKVWGIHTQNDRLFLSNHKIAIGWQAFGDLTKVEATREAFKDRYVEAYPEAKKGSIPTSSGMLYRFLHEVQVGDYVVFPSKSDRMINIGIIEGDYRYEPGEEEYVQQRDVRWLKHLPRTYFSQGALYEIGSAMSFFAVKKYADEFLAALDKDFRKSMAEADEEDDSVAATAEDIIESTRDFILKELSKNLKGYELEGFVADLLQAMGYRTTLSSHGGDSGIDITAYKDELPPRILVQVKSQDSDIKETTIQSLKGAMREGDYGLFVTLSNYTRNAQKYLENTPIIRGINGTELVDLILKYYDGLSEKYRRMIPLKMVYIPVAREENN